MDFASYRDQWLSEGFSNFSGLWYTQIALKKSKYYFDQLDLWKTDLRARQGEVGPVGLGYRTATASDGSEYGLVVYQKGAWALHMLRILMLDLRTMKEEKFEATMRDYFQTYKGRAASTDDFRRIAEQHAGSPLDWFFDQWLTTTAIPEYRVAWTAAPGEAGKYVVKLRVKQQNVSETFLAYVPIKLELEGGGVARLRVKVQGPLTEISPATDAGEADVAAVQRPVRCAGGRPHGEVVGRVAIPESARGFPWTVSISPTVSGMDSSWPVRRQASSATSTSAPNTCC
ncbi:MAG: hypothetical protein IPP98_15480 [Gemmatimonadetes bacterium]|nr:hypothetical protein [Gemmatimonadota bacterium]